MQKFQIRNPIRNCMTASFQQTPKKLKKLVKKSNTNEKMGQDMGKSSKKTNRFEIYLFYIPDLMIVLKDLGVSMSMQQITNSVSPGYHISCEKVLFKKNMRQQERKIRLDIHFPNSSSITTHIFFNHIQHLHHSGTFLFPLKQSLIIQYLILK